MSKIKAYLNKIFSKSQPAQQNLVECQDFWGNTVIVPQEQTVRIYDADMMLKDLTNMFVDYKKYIEMNNELRNIGKNTSAFIYHESVDTLSKNLAVLDFYQNLIILDKKTNNGAVDFNIYHCMLEQNFKMEQIALNAINDINTAIEIVSIEDDGGYRQTAEYLDDAVVGLIFQRDTLVDDLNNCYQFYKLIDPQTDNVIFDDQRLNTVAKTVSTVQNIQILPTPDTDYTNYNDLKI